MSMYEFWVIQTDSDKYVACNHSNREYYLTNNIQNPQLDTSIDEETCLNMIEYIKLGKLNDLPTDNTDRACKLTVTYHID